MKCPVMTAGNFERFPPEKDEFIDCLKEECAWWDEIDERCVLVTLVDKIADMRDDLIQIRDKMPHTGQFTK